MAKNKPNYKKKKVLVIGDIMLDVYLRGESTKIAQEGPIPIIKETSNNYMLGGAGFVAINCKNLNFDVTICSLLGYDTESNKILKLLKLNKIKSKIYRDKNFITTTKKRVLSNNTYTARIDRENSNYEFQNFDKLIEFLKKNIHSFDTIIVSDYAKGFVVKPNLIIKLANKYKVPILIDPKGLDFLKYKNSTSITPNLHEFEAIVGKIRNNKDLINKGIDLKKKLVLNFLVVTMAEKGVMIIDDKNHHHFYQNQIREVRNIIGAGDVFISALACSLNIYRNIQFAARFANDLAGKSVEIEGNNAVKNIEITKSLIESLNEFNQIQNYYDEILKIKNLDKKIVFTNGCFDILHKGHISLFKFAKKQGDFLIVALNKDESIKKIKGPDRPINDYNDRLEILKSIKYIDLVIGFDETSPIKLIKKIKPNILIKGGDYKIDDIVGKNIVEKNGGKVMICPLQKNKSSTKIINRIKKK